MSDLGNLLRTGTSRFFSTSAVHSSKDLERVLALPRRPLTDGVSLVEELTNRLKRPGGLMTLRPIQALALHELETYGGLVGNLSVSSGKTLIGLLAGTLLKAKTTVMLVPSPLRDQVKSRLYEEYLPHWYIPKLGEDLHVIGHGEISRIKLADILEELQPQLLVIDECHAFSRNTAARTKRIFRYVRNSRKIDPQAVKTACLSGTILSKSIRDLGVITKLVLNQGSPLPITWQAMEEWALAIDPTDWQVPPGELLKLCNEGETLHEGIKRRVLDTPGVISGGSNDVSASLVLYKRSITLPKEIKNALQQLKETWCTPGGEECSDALSIWRHQAELAAGFYYKWVWPKGESPELQKEWLLARAQWNKEVREYLSHRAKSGMDSPLFLFNAARDGLWESQHWSKWNEIQDQAKPKTEAVWISEFLIEDAIRWGKEHVGIIWTEFGALARKLVERGGFPYFGGGADKALALEKGDRTIIASRRSHGEGKLLEMFSNMLLISTPSSGKVWEQTMGRSHRSGQKADQVSVWTYLHTPGNKDALKQARKDAKFLEIGSTEKQKLTTLDFTF